MGREILLHRWHQACPKRQVFRLHPLQLWLQVFRLHLACPMRLLGLKGQQPPMGQARIPLAQ